MIQVKDKMEAEPKPTNVEYLHARRAEFAQKLADMSIRACDDDGQVMDYHKLIIFPRQRVTGGEEPPNIVA